MIKACVFDLDGTLIDARRNLQAAVQYLRGTMNVEPLQPGCDASFSGNGLNSPLRRAIADAEVDEKTALTRMKKFYTGNLQQTIRLYPGVEAGLKELHSRHIKLAVWSNKPVKAVNVMLEKLQISRYFCDIIGGDGDTPLKPAPDALLALQKKYALPAAGCWMAGDSLADMQAGKAAGFRRIFMAYGQNVLDEDQADYTASSFTEFLNVIRGF